jgi:hypothetical protein
MKDITKMALNSVFSLLTGALLAIVVQGWNTQAASQVRYLDYIVNYRPGILTRPDIHGRKIEILLDQKPIENLSEVEVSVYNFSDRDYEDVDFYVDLVPAGGPVEVLAQDVVGARGRYETVEPLRDVVPDPGELRYGYRVKTLNRSGFDVPAFQARYLTLGGTSPRARVEAIKTGVELRPFFEGMRNPFPWSSLGAILLGLLLLTLPVLWIDRMIARKRMISTDKKLHEALRQSLAEAEKRGASAELQDSSRLALHVMSLFQRARWDSTPRLKRWASGVPEPPGRPP